MATHSSVLAWRIPGTGESDGLPSMGSHRVGHDWSDLAAAVGMNSSRDCGLSERTAAPLLLNHCSFFLNKKAVKSKTQWKCFKWSYPEMGMGGCFCKWRNRETERDAGDERVVSGLLNVLRQSSWVSLQFDTFKGKNLRCSHQPRNDKLCSASLSWNSEAQNHVGMERSNPSDSQNWAIFELRAILRSFHSTLSRWRWGSKW